MVYACLETGRSGRELWLRNQCPVPTPPPPEDENIPGKVGTASRAGMGDWWAKIVLGLIIEGVSRRFDIQPSAILSKSRSKAHVANARFLSVYLAHVAAGIRQSFIAECIGRQRSGVGYACQTVEDWRDDPLTDWAICLHERELGITVVLS